MSPVAWRPVANLATLVLVDTQALLPLQLEARP